MYIISAYNIAIKDEDRSSMGTAVQEPSHTAVKEEDTYSSSGLKPLTSAGAQHIDFVWHISSEWALATE